MAPFCHLTMVETFGLSAIWLVKLIPDRVIGAEEEEVAAHGWDS